MATSKQLIDSGYCRTSNKYGLISRIDREDWRDFMAQSHAPWNIEDGRKWVKCLGTQAGDHYRRVYSKDTIQLGRGKAASFPASMGGPDEFKAKVF